MFLINFYHIILLQMDFGKREVTSLACKADKQQEVQVLNWLLRSQKTHKAASWYNLVLGPQFGETDNPEMNRSNSSLQLNRS